MVQRSITAIQRNGIHLEFDISCKMHQDLHENDVFYSFNELQCPKTCFVRVLVLSEIYMLTAFQIIM